MPMDKWPQVDVAILPVEIDHAPYTVVLAVGVGPLDIKHQRTGNAWVEGDTVHFEGPPCRFTFSWRVQETGQVGPTALPMSDGIYEPRMRFGFQPKPTRA